MSGLDSNITLSRIRPPELPANFLSRRHLFELIDDRAPGYTMVVAPPGYGKTSLFAEWVAQSNKKVVWYAMSENDSVEGVAKYLISAVRQTFPNFFSDLEASTVTSVFQAIADLDEDIVLVLDNVVDAFTYQLNLTQSYMDVIPDNIHIFALRRTMPTVSLKRFSSIGRLSVISAGDLVFSKQEIKSLIQVSGAIFTEDRLNEIVQQTYGWPAAVALVINGEEIDLQKEPDENFLQNLILDKFKKMPIETREILTTMSTFEVFDLDLLSVLVNHPINIARLNGLVSEGIFLMLAAGQIGTYIFNRAAREVIDEIAREERETYRANQIAASVYYQKLGQVNDSIAHAIKSGDSEYLRNMFKPALRTLISKGEGKNILFWSNFLPVDSSRNVMFAELAKIMGHLVSYEFDRTIQLVEEMRFASKDSQLSGFVERITAITLVHVAFSRGRLAEFDKHMEVIFREPVSGPAFENSDQLNIFRLQASRAFIFEDDAMLNLIEAEVGKIIKDSSSPEDFFVWQTIRAMKLFLDGEYLQAFDAAFLSEEIAQRNKFSGFTGCAEAIYIKARCYLEFSEEKNASQELERLARFTREWQQWPWVFMAESYLARIMVISGRVEEAFAVIRDHRQLASEFKGEDGISLIIDINELYLRFWVKDYERSNQILNRLPKDLIFTHQYRQALSAVSKNEVKKRVIPEIFETDSAREQIWKSLVGCEANIDQESLAMDSLKKGLDVGARVGARETFLKQDPTILELIIRSASKRPTVYLEDLARAAAQRMNKKNLQNISLSDPLTKREIDVLRSLASGKPITEIGKNLHISHNTMKTHLRNIYRKLRVRGRDEAVEKAQALFII